MLISKFERTQKKKQKKHGEGGSGKTLIKLGES